MQRPLKDGNKIAGTYGENSFTSSYPSEENLVLAGLRLGLKNRQVGEKWVSDDCSYLCKGLF
jgi:hypothetical protein